MTGEECVLAIEDNGTDAAFHAVAIGALAETRASCCSSQALSDATSGLLLSWRTRRRSSALIPRIIFSIA
jgi:hypothetical protein